MKIQTSNQMQKNLATKKFSRNELLINLYNIKIKSNPPHSIFNLIKPLRGAA